MKSRIKLIAIVAALVITAAAVIAVLYRTSGSHLSLSMQSIDTRPSRIEQIREIGQWEFMAFHNEEIVDTTATVRRPWPLPDGKKQLARIYSGTLRLGFDLHTDTVAGWLHASGDSITVKLPPVRLLDERFIDEAATRPLIEEGSWTHADRAALTRKAARKMKASVLTPANIKRADEAAQSRMRELLTALGYTHIDIVR